MKSKTSVTGSKLLFLKRIIYIYVYIYRHFSALILIMIVESNFWKEYFPKYVSISE